MPKGLSATSFYRSVRSAKVHTGVTEVMAGFVEDEPLQLPLHQRRNRHVRAL